MTDSDKPQKCEKKIETIEDFYDLRLEGWKETQGKDKYWKISKTGYFPVRIPQQLVKKYPSEFGEKIPQSPELYRKIADRQNTAPPAKDSEATSPETQDIPTGSNPVGASTHPGTFIHPLDFILHDTARRALESVWVLEGLHKIDKQKRHELPFAHVGLDAKGNPQSVEKFGDKSEILLSLADLAVYFLIDCYMKYQKADETIISLNVEKMMLYTSYMQEKEKRKELEDALMLKMILKI